MDYRVLIFMTKDRLAAIDIDSEDVPDTISMDGNEDISYASEAQLEEFCEHIKEYYNMDRFSDGRMEISILRFDAVMEDTFCLFNILQREGAGECNLVSAEKFLPWVALKEGLLKVGTAVQMKAFDLIYTVTLDNDRKLTCQCGGTGEVQPFIVTKEEIARYNYISKKALSGGEEEKKAYEKTLKETERERAKLDKQLKAAQKKQQEAETDAAKMQAVLEERQHAANRQICYLRCSDKAKDKIYVDDYGDADADDIIFGIGKKYEYSIKYWRNTGDTIAKGAEIAEVTVKLKGRESVNFSGSSGIFGSISSFMAQSITTIEREAWGEGKFSIKAKTGGRLFWLQETVSEGIPYGDAIAVIGDESDTKEDALRWYAKNK